MERSADGRFRTGSGTRRDILLLRRAPWAHRADRLLFRERPFRITRHIGPASASRWSSHPNSSLVPRRGPRLPGFPLPIHLDDDDLGDELPKRVSLRLVRCLRERELVRDVAPFRLHRLGLDRDAPSDLVRAEGLDLRGLRAMVLAAVHFQIDNG